MLRSVDSRLETQAADSRLKTADRRLTPTDHLQLREARAAAFGRSWEDRGLDVGRAAFGASPPALAEASCSTVMPFLRLGRFAAQGAGGLGGARWGDLLQVAPRLGQWARPAGEPPWGWPGGGLRTFEGLAAALPGRVSEARSVFRSQAGCWRVGRSRNCRSISSMKRLGSQAVSCPSGSGSRHR